MWAEHWNTRKGQAGRDGGSTFQAEGTSRTRTLRWAAGGKQGWGGRDTELEEQEGARPPRDKEDKEGVCILL